MDHATFRRRIAVGEVADDLRVHVRTCPPCRAFVAELQRLDEVATDLVPEPPPGLADRVLEAFEAAQRDGTVAAFAPPPQRRAVQGLRRLTRDTAFRLTAAAAALVLLAAALIVLPDHGDDPAAVLVASAAETAAAGSADVEVEASAELVLTSTEAVPDGALPPPPDLDVAPPEMRDWLDDEWARAIAEFERALDEFTAEMERTMDDFARQLDEAARDMERGLRHWAPAEPGQAPPPPDRAHEPPPAPRHPGGGEARERRERGELPPPPRSVSARVVIGGHGTVDFGRGSMALDGDVRADGRAGAAPFRLAVDGSSRAVATADGSWLEVPEVAGPIGAVLLEPRQLLSLVERAADVRRDGHTTIDGERVERYRFRVPAGELPPELRAGGDRTGEAWVGPDGLLRHVQLTGEDAIDVDGDAQWTTRVAVTLSAFGRDVPVIDRPAAEARIEVPTRTSVPLYPFGPSITGSARADATVETP